MMKDEELMMKDDDIKLLRGFDDEQTYRQTTFVNVESLSRLKTIADALSSIQMSQPPLTNTDNFSKPIPWKI